jgi:hypothetical protein
MIRSTMIRRNISNYLGPYTANLDPRLYAFRAGMRELWPPSAEMVDDVMAARPGVHQRWQTKRGQPGAAVVDWIILDVDGTIFPSGSRQLRQISRAARIRFPLAWVIESAFSRRLRDFFQEVVDVSLGDATATRPTLRRIANMEGPFSSTLLVGTASYRLSQSGY